MFQDYEFIHLPHTKLLDFASIYELELRIDTLFKKLNYLILIHPDLFDLDMFLQLIYIKVI